MRATLERVPPHAESNAVMVVGAEFPLPRAERGELVRGQAPLLRVGADGALTLDGAPGSTSAAQLEFELPELLARPGGERALYLAFAADAPLAPHRGWLMALSEQVPLRVLVRTPSPSPPRTPSGDAALARTRAAADPTARIVALVESLKAVGAGCESLSDGFEAMASAPADRKNGMLMNLALDSAAACGCDKLDVDALTALIWYLLMGDDPGLRWLPLRLEITATRLIPGDATAQEMATILVSEPRLGFAPH